MSTGSGGYQGPVTLQLRLPGEPLSAREARRAITTWALTHGVGPEVDDLQLVTSELVANAASHGSGQVTVEAEHTGTSIRVRVSDSGALPPQPRQPSDDDDSGRGLLIVAALAHSWGSVIHADSTEVWAELLLNTP